MAEFKPSETQEMIGLIKRIATGRWCEKEEIIRACRKVLKGSDIGFKKILIERRKSNTDTVHGLKIERRKSMESMSEELLGKIIDYDIVTAVSGSIGESLRKNIVTEIKQKMLDGWEPIGGISDGSDRLCVSFSQAIVKRFKH